MKSGRLPLLRTGPAKKETGWMEVGTMYFELLLNGYFIALVLASVYSQNRIVSNGLTGRGVIDIHW
jgi:hypothetical protein